MAESELQVLLGLLLVPIPRQISAFLVELWSFLWLFFHRILQKLSVSGFRRAISQHTRQPWSSCLNATLKINICTVPNKCFNILLSLNSPVISRKENSDALPARSSLNHHTFFPKSPCCHTPSVHSCQSVGVEGASEELNRRNAEISCRCVYLTWLKRCLWSLYANFWPAVRPGGVRF